MRHTRQDNASWRLGAYRWCVCNPCPDSNPEHCDEAVLSIKEEIEIERKKERKRNEGMLLILDTEAEVLFDMKEKCRTVAFGPHSRVTDLALACVEIRPSSFR